MCSRYAWALTMSSIGNLSCSQYRSSSANVDRMNCFMRYTHGVHLSNDEGEMSELPRKYPDLTIRFPHDREAELLGEMTRLAQPPWSRQDLDTHGGPPREGNFFFHRDEVGDDPALAAVIQRREPGVLIATHLVPDEIGPHLDVAQYDRILRELDEFIVDPAAKAVDGLSDIDLTDYRLEDYFSPTAVALLEDFSQCNGYGSHPSDREIWYSFLIQVFDDGNKVNADTFRNAAKAAELWPSEYAEDFSRQYDLAMDILERSGRRKLSE